MDVPCVFVDGFSFDNTHGTVAEVEGARGVELVGFDAVGSFVGVVMVLKSHVQAEIVEDGLPEFPCPYGA